MPSWLKSRAEVFTSARIAFSHPVRPKFPSPCRSSTARSPARAERHLAGVVDVRQPILRFVRGLCRVHHLVRDQQAELQANIVSRQHILSRHQRRRFAEILAASGVEATPANVPARREDFHELTLAIQQTRMTLRHNVGVANLANLQ